MSVLSKIATVGSLAAASMVGYWSLGSPIEENILPYKVLPSTIQLIKSEKLRKHTSAPLDYGDYYGEIYKYIEENEPSKKEIVSDLPLFFIGVNVMPTVDNYLLLKNEIERFSSAKLSTITISKGQFL